MGPKECDGTVWTGFFCFRVWTGGGTKGLSGRTVAIGFEHRLEYTSACFAKHVTVLLGANSVTAATNITQIRGI